jgi:hypothetical protein
MGPLPKGENYPPISQGAGVLISYFSFVISPSLLLYSFKFADFLAAAALRAFLGMNGKALDAVSDDRPEGALGGADTAVPAQVAVDLVPGQLPAFTGAAFFLQDVLLVFTFKISHCREHRVRGVLAEPAQRSFYHRPEDLAQGRQVFDLALSIANAVEDMQRLVAADAAGHTFAAGLIHTEPEIEFGNIYHAVIGIHDDHAA